MKKIKKGIVLLVVLVAVFVPLYQVFAATTESGSVSEDLIDTSDNLLGIASQFHIFAETATLNAHTEGNLAVDDLTGNSNFGTNGIANSTQKDLYYIKTISTINGGSFVSGNNTKAVLGSSITVTNNANQVFANGAILGNIPLADVYTDTVDTYLNIDNTLADLATTSASLATVATSDGVVENFTDMNKRTIDLSNAIATNGVITINLTADELAQSTPIYFTVIRSTAGYTVVINATDTTTVNSHIYMEIDGQNVSNGEVSDYSNNVVLWNFGTTSNTININAVFVGSLLAPNANLSIGQNLNGNIVAKNVVINAESHRWDLQPTTMQITPPTENSSTENSSTSSSSTSASSSTSDSSSSTSDSTTSSSTTDSSSSTSDSTMSSSTTDSSSSTSDSTTGSSTNDSSSSTSDSTTSSSTADSSSSTSDSTTSSSTADSSSSTTDSTTSSSTTDSSSSTTDSTTSSSTTDSSSSTTDSTTSSSTTDSSATTDSTTSSTTPNSGTLGSSSTTDSTSSTTDSTTSSSTTDSSSSTTGSTTSSTTPNSGTLGSSSTTDGSSSTTNSTTSDSSTSGSSTTDSTTNSSMNSTNSSTSTSNTPTETSSANTSSGLPQLSDVSSWSLIALGGALIGAAIYLFKLKK
ncbi:collagen-binding domain-containing protein [Enterococcus sp. HY326]|uniref:collagen-binding domain-containing protein n=1 Tax=Enterococcus sp. HY326 TaxID=2971265 RepID=UPI0022407876|nr:collagen-binding domain-containing protein [Enterococcus sp. HY326]